MIETTPSTTKPPKPCPLSTQQSPTCREAPELQHASRLLKTSQEAENKPNNKQAPAAIPMLRASAHPKNVATWANYWGQPTGTMWAWYWLAGWAEQKKGVYRLMWIRCRSKPYRGWVCKWLWYTDIVTDGLQAPQETAIGCRVVLNKGTLQALRRCEAIAPVRQRKLRRRTASEQRTLFLII
jgi:hypothetical protein